jgi:Uma2 family endonuclease
MTIKVYIREYVQEKLIVMSAAEKPYSLEEYLIVEEEAGIKYEYYDGFLVAMAGGTVVHSQIGMNIGVALANALRHQECIAYSSDARVAIEEANAYLYPDATVACPPIETVQGHSIANLSVIVEIMSEASERYDRGEKFRLYRQIPSMKHYLLVSQHAPRVEMYTRNSEGFWVLSEIEGAGELALTGIGISISLEDIYWKVAFEGKK